MWRDDAYVLDMLLAGRVSSEYQDHHGEVPWREMAGMRNRLVHEYFRILPRRVWDVVEKDIPKLIKVLEPLVPEDEGGSLFSDTPE